MAQSWRLPRRIDFVSPVPNDSPNNLYALFLLFGSKCRQGRADRVMILVFACDVEIMNLSQFNQMDCHM